MNKAGSSNKEAEIVNTKEPNRNTGAEEYNVKRTKCLEIISTRFDQTEQFLKRIHKKMSIQKRKKNRNGRCL